jgi:hypothetical protein
MDHFCITSWESYLDVVHGVFNSDLIFILADIAVRPAKALDSRFADRRSVPAC